MTEAASLPLTVGSRVLVEHRGPGMVAMDNDDGTFNVELDDGDECDVPRPRLTMLTDQSLHALRSHTAGWPQLLPSGIRVVDPTAAIPDQKPEGWTRFVCFSDTHGLHGSIPKDHIVPGDVLLHAGDFSNTGS